MVLMKDGTMHSWERITVKLTFGTIKSAVTLTAGIITSTDVTYLRRYILKIIKDFPVPNGKYAADMDSDGYIDSYDLMLKKKYFEKVRKLGPA